MLIIAQGRPAQLLEKQQDSRPQRQEADGGHVNASETTLTVILKQVVKFMATLKDEEISMSTQRLLLNDCTPESSIVSAICWFSASLPSTHLTPYPLQITHPCAPPHGNVKYAYRTADGSFNNPLVPTLGQAGTPYVCSMPSANFSPRQALPELSTQAVGVIRTEFDNAVLELCQSPPFEHAEFTLTQMSKILANLLVNHSQDSILLNFLCNANPHAVTGFWETWSNLLYQLRLLDALLSLPADTYTFLDTESWQSMTSLLWVLPSNHQQLMFRDERGIPRNCFKCWCNFADSESLEIRNCIWEMVCFKYQ